MRDRTYCVYILSSRFKTLYIGMTNDITRRLAQHRERRPGTYCARYRIDRLVHVETFNDPSMAIAREKELKAWRREKKVRLIEAGNPDWRELSSGW